MAKILIIEDEIEVRSVIRRMLEREGHTVLEAEDGDAGIQLYKKQPSDLIITDIIMPGKEGIETILEFRRLFPEAKIVAVSGGGKIDADSYLSLARRIGAVYTLTKPFSWSQLLDVVQKALAQEE